MRHHILPNSPLATCPNPWMVLVAALALSTFACGDDPTYAEGSITQDDSPTPDNEDSNNTDAVPEDNTPDVDEDEPLPTDNNTPAPDPDPDPGPGPDPDCECEADMDCPEGFACDACQCVETCLCNADSDCDSGDVCNNCECIPAQTIQGCTGACQERLDSQDERGLCPFEVMQEASCEDTCSDIQSRFGDDTKAAVETCIVNDPMCFSSLDNCIFGTLYPEGTNAVLRATASGFDEFEGLPVFAALSVGRQTFIEGPIQIIEGRWSVSWEERIALASSFTVYFFIDTNGDERCDATIDHANSGRIERGSDYEAPAYSGAILNDDDRSFRVVCDVFR